MPEARQPARKRRTRARLDKSSTIKVPKGQLFPGEDPEMAHLRERLAPPAPVSVGAKGKRVALGKIDFSGVREFKPVPGGSYECTFSGWELKESKDKSSEYIRAQFTIDDGDEQGQMISNNWSLKAQALWRVKQDAIAMGADPEDFNEDTDLADVLNKLKGSSVIVDVVLKEVASTKPGHEGELVPVNEVTGIREAMVGAARR